MKKYLIIPGYVMSQYDDDFHWISADKLMRLYGVHHSECIVQPHQMLVSTFLRLHPDPKLIILTPQQNGNYNLKEETNDQTRSH